MNTEEVTDTVPNRGNPAGHLIPNPACKALDARPQALHDIFTDLDDRHRRLADPLQDSRNDLRQGGHQLRDSPHQPHGQLYHQLNPHLHDFREVVCDKADNGRDNLWQCRDEPGQRVQKPLRQALNNREGRR